MEEIKKEPAIRFKGFSDSWEQRKLGEVFVSLQNNTLSRAELSEESGVAKNIHYGDILVKYGEVLDVEKANLPLISDDSVLVKYRASLLQNGDVVVADTAEDSTVGKCSEIVGLKDNNVLSGLHTIPYRPTLKFASGFLGYYLNSSTYHNQLIPLMQGIKVTSISKSAMQDTCIGYPKADAEQSKIGIAFRSLDHLITLHQRKLEGLKKMKKALLEKMFPRDGEDRPAVRFKGFADSWEQRKFSELVETRRGLTYKPIDIREKGIRVLRSSNIDEDYFVVKDDDVFVDENAIRICLAKENDILITAANGSSRLVGKHAIICNIPDNSAVHGGFMLLGISKEPYFANASMSSSWYKRFIDLFVAGGNGAIGNLNKRDLDEQVVLVPRGSEQQVIGRVFLALDRLITLHQRKCDRLKSIKKAMLEKMFV